MYKLIIIDDEEEIRSGLKFFINTTQSEFEVIGEFEDGREAIDFLKENEVDVVITDIKMTNVTGLDIMKFVYENCVDTKVIVISGYMDFNYSAKAIEYKARYYITKPTKYKELINVFSTVTAELKEEYDKKQKDKKNLIKNEYFKNEFLKSIYNNEISESEFLKKLSLVDDEKILQKSKFSIISLGIADYEEYCIHKWKIGDEQFYEKIVDFVTGFFVEYSINCVSVYRVRGKFKFIVYTDFFENTEAFSDEISEKISELNVLSAQDLDLKIKAHISKVFSDIYMFFNNESEKLDLIENNSAVNNEDMLIKIKEYIFSKITGDISLQQVADHFHYNMKYFSHSFKQLSGENFSSYVTNLRINMAKELLKNTDEKIADIAEKTGYSNLQYFMKIFKKTTGLTPAEYRQKVQN